MNLAELDLRPYGVTELPAEDAMRIGGGNPWIVFWTTVAAGLAVNAITDVVENPDDFMEGYNAARS